MEYVIFVLIGLVGSIVSAIFGFGTALLVLAIGAHILPIKETIALATVLFTASTLTKTILFRRYIEWKTVAILTVGSLPFAYFGGLLVEAAPAELLRRLLGVTVLGYLGLSFSKWKPQFKLNNTGLVLGSSLYGFISGLLGSGNIVKVFMFREMGLQKQAFVGAMAASSVMANAAKLTAYTQTTLLTADHQFTIVALIASAMCAALVGRYVLHRISDSSFQYGVTITLAIVALGLLF